MKLLIFLSLLLAVSALASSPKVKVYRWVDENGVVTFSEYRPQQSKYVELEIEGDRVLRGKQQGIDIELPLKASDQSDNMVTELNTQAKRYCEKALHNLKILESFNKVRVLDEKGKPKTLTENDVAQQKRLANRQVELFCN